MAKVRLQAGSSSIPGPESQDAESDSELRDIQGAEEGSLTASYAEVTKSGHVTQPRLSQPTKSKKPQRSAVALLAKVLREEGVLGWYQVCCFRCWPSVWIIH